MVHKASSSKIKLGHKDFGVLSNSLSLISQKQHMSAGASSLSVGRSQETPQEQEEMNQERGGGYLGRVRGQVNAVGL